MSKIIRPLATALLAAICISAHAQPGAGIPVNLNPIQDVTPHQGDDYTVLAFFKFGCSVCRSYHMALDNWGASLPKPFHVQFLPILESAPGEEISKESSLGLMMFWTMELAGNEMQRTNFAESAYGLVQDAHKGSEMAAWLKASADSGVSKQNFQRAFAKEKSNWQSRAARQIHYQPSATPTLVICGKWAITPDSTNGNQNMFFQLANGLVSKCMVAHGMAKGG